VNTRQLGIGGGLPPSSGLRLDLGPLLWLEAIQVGQYPFHSSQGKQKGPVAQQEIPVEGIEGTGPFAHLFAGIVAAMAAVVTHFADVLGGSGVGFGGKHAPVGKEAHADDVGLHHPVVAVDEHVVKPRFYGLRLDTADEREIAEHH